MVVQPHPEVMEIRLERLSNERHRLCVRRAGLADVVCELETRSVLLHDLVHFAVEREAGLTDGFWGSLAAGASFDELQHDASSQASVLRAERLVAPMQSVWNGRLPAARYVEMLRDEMPFVTEDFVARVLERIRRLWGHWQGTPFREAMVLTWTVGDDGAARAPGGPVAARD